MTTKFKNFAKKITSSIKVLALFLSIWTMTFSTVALGVQSEKQLKKVQNFILDTGLSKKTTYKEFWNKTKHIYPGQVYKQVEKFFLANPNEIMPKFAVREVTNSKGEKTIALSIDGGGKSHQVQILAQKEKWATFDNVTLTPADVNLLEPALVKIEKGMQSKNKSSKNQSTAVKPTVAEKFDYPSIDKAMWKQMTPIERAQHIVYLRALWSAAEDVLAIQEAKTEKGNTSSLDKWNLFIKFLVEEAVAKGKAGDSCVVAGYVGEYGLSGKKLSCQYPPNKDESCSMPCSPMIYGYASGGKTICVPNRKDLQKATDFNGYCDKNAPLSVNRLHYPKPPDANKTTAQYKDAVEKNKAQLMSSEVDKKLNLDMTEKYLKSHLAKKDGKYLDMFEKGEFTNDLLKEVKIIEANFENQIILARNSCSGVSDGTNKPDPNFYKACDQLHKRFLLVKEYFGAKCPTDAPINNGLKCECSNDKTKTLNPNSKETCEKAVVVAPIVVKPEPAPPVEDKTCDPDYAGLKLDENCLCEETKEMPRGETSFFSKETKFTCDKAFNWKPLAWIAGGIGVAALLYFLLKKDDDDDKKKTPPPPGPPPPPPPPPPPVCTNMCDANSTRNDTTCVCTPNFNPETCAITYDAEFCPSEGGSGDSCPSGDCSGGVPGAVN